MSILLMDEEIEKAWLNPSERYLKDCLEHIAKAQARKDLDELKRITDNNETYDIVRKVHGLIARMEAELACIKLLENK